MLTHACAYDDVCILTITCISISTLLLNKLNIGTKTWDADSTRRITSIVPQDDGSDSTIITVDHAITRSLPGLLGPGESVYAVEIASLSRSVHFTADNDDPDGPHVGGHFMIGWTPNVEQVIAGVKIDNFGQGGILGRYPIHFHLSGVSPSTVAKNVIINSNHRCILIHEILMVRLLIIMYAIIIEVTVLPQKWGPKMIIYSSTIL